jgi:hypothetical protein
LSCSHTQNGRSCTALGRFHQEDWLLAAIDYSCAAQDPGLKLALNNELAATLPVSRADALHSVITLSDTRSSVSVQPGEGPVRAGRV